MQKISSEHFMPLFRSPAGIQSRFDGSLTPPVLQKSATGIGTSFKISILDGNLGPRSKRCRRCALPPHSKFHWSPTSGTTGGKLTARRLDPTTAIEKGCNINRVAHHPALNHFR